MTKLRKQRRKKRFRTDVNRKKLRNKLRRKGKIQCKEIAENWENGLTLQKNIQQMGLVYDPNETFKIPNKKDELKSEVVSVVGVEEDDDEPETSDAKPSKKYVADLLEKEAKAPRKRTFRLPKSQVEFITYLLDKHGHDYKAMTRDRRNYYQETWKQLRAKVKLFMKIPEQYNEYLKERGLLGEEKCEPNEVSVDDDSD